MRKALTALTVAAVATALLPGVPAAATAKPSAVRWGPCPESVAASNLECSTLKVPLDYRKPNGRTIDIAISRLASKDPTRRRGVLLLNPGGPGAAGLRFPADLVAAGMPRSVLDTYDVIGFDPRGVGHSTPVTCALTPEQQLRGNIPPYAPTPADVAKQAKQAKAIARQCATSKTGFMLPYVTTANTARDMDRIRQALGEPKLSYLGYSYGTHLGAVYTTLFPQRGDRIVIDSNLPPRGVNYEDRSLFAQGVEDRFPDFAEYAAAHPGHGLGSTPEQVREKYFELAGRLDTTPFQGADGALFRLLTFSMLFNDANFPALAGLWQAFDTGQMPAGAADDSVLYPDNLMSSHQYVVCDDSRWPRSIPTYRRAVEADRKHYPMFGAASANIRPCAFWPSGPIEAPVRVTDRGPSNVLMVQFLRDPGTPLAGARKMQRALGNRARMVTVDQGGHGVYLLGKNTCADTAVTTFLTTGKRPVRELACAAEPA
ncbi:alpha/beta hydrolase [Nonomuraea sp. C10]|uniref:alpha/beta hydrolase n=1 Tax=Nonomuraea sp. C10 TaxID=2600577 RepID=UPI0011CEA47B|nr:alpha/beta hydrolase [Nonomuraea sp. C10]TXK39985.1 alpha/beta hydrolase [Nonomuraea sp. C10]